MSKFYIQSGELQTVIAGEHIETAEQAACEALLITKTNEIAPLIVVSERGFDLVDHQQGDDTFFATVDILKKTGLLCEPGYNEEGLDDYER
jgi:hypothetical protein